MLSVEELQPLDKMDKMERGTICRVHILAAIGLSTLIGSLFWFPSAVPAELISKEYRRLHATFLEAHTNIAKPPDVMLAEHELASQALLERGHYVDAANQCSEALEIALQVEYPQSIVNARRCLALTHFRLGHLEQAQREYEKALILTGEADAHRSAILHALGDVKREAGRIQDALEFYNKARAIRVLHGDRWQLIQLLVDEGEACWNRGNASDALQKSKQALVLHSELKSMSQSVTEVNLQAGAIYSLMGRSQYLLGDVDHSLASMEKALQLQVTLWQGHPDAVLTRIGISLDHRDMGNMSLSLQALRVSEVALRDSPHEGPELGYILEKKALYLSEIGLLAEALDFVKESEKLQRNVFGSEDNPKLAYTLNTYGHILFQAGRPEDAMAKHKDALRINLNTVGKFHRRTSSTYNNIGLLLDHLGDPAGAEQHFSKSMEIDIAVHGASGPNVGIMQNNIAMLRFRQGKIQEAIQMLQHGLDILRADEIPEESPHWIGLMKNLEFVKSQLKK